MVVCRHDTARLFVGRVSEIPCNRGDPMHSIGCGDDRGDGRQGRGGRYS